MIDATAPETAFAMRMVRRAAQLARRIQSEMVVEGMEKRDLSPVTIGDYASQAMLGQALWEAFPHDVLVGEESASDLRVGTGSAALAVVTQYVADEVEGATADRVCDWIDRGAAEPGGRFWTLDPIDGTKGYLRGGHYAVALALIEEGEVVLGALGCPHLDASGGTVPGGSGSLLVAVRGQGTWTAPLDGRAELQRLRVSACRNARDARVLRSVESGHTDIGAIDHICEALGIEAEPVRMDSQAKYGTLAAGGGELLLRLLSPKNPDYKEKIWDQAAGSIILEEAGGRITDLEGKALDFTQGRTLSGNTGVFASNGLLHEAGLKAIAQVCGR